MIKPNIGPTEYSVLEIITYFCLANYHYVMTKRSPCLLGSCINYVRFTAIVLHRLYHIEKPRTALSLDFKHQSAEHKGRANVIWLYVHCCILERSESTIRGRLKPLCII